MKEDDKFFDFIKSNLEEGASVSPKTLASIKAFAKAEALKRKRVKMFRWLSAAAASLAVMCGVGFYLFGMTTTAHDDGVYTDDRQIVRTIELFDDSEDLADVDDMDDVDVLLAWQDAPYRHIEDDMLMDGEIINL